MSTRTVTWGDALLVKAVKHPGGLNKAVDNIRGVIGAQIGVRNSFAKLYAVEDPSGLNDRDQWRAWLLLTAIGEDADDWGIYPGIIPAIHADRVDTLRRLLNGSGRPSDYRAPISSHTEIHRARPTNRNGNTGPKGRAR